MTGAIGVMALIAGFCWEASLTAEGIVGKLIAVVVSALAAVAAVGVAIWAALPTVSSHGVRMSRTDCATAGPGGRANSGFSGPASSLPDDVLVDRTGDAVASSDWGTNRQHHRPFGKI